MSSVYVKTPKGVEEMTNRSGGLTARIRRVLIMLDGKRTVEDIRGMALVDDLNQTLGLLEESGFIEIPGKTGAAAASAPAANGGLSASTSFREIPARPDPKELDMAKNFIMNSLRTFCGPSTHLSIIEAAFAARTHEELREHYVPWFNSIVETRDGRRRADELQAQLLKVI